MLFHSVNILSRDLKIVSKNCFFPMAQLWHDDIDNYWTNKC